MSTISFIDGFFTGLCLCLILATFGEIHYYRKYEQMRSMMNDAISMAPNSKEIQNKIFRDYKTSDG